MLKVTVWISRLIVINWANSIPFWHVNFMLLITIKEVEKILISKNALPFKGVWLVSLGIKSIGCSNVIAGNGCPKVINLEKSVAKKERIKTCNKRCLKKIRIRQCNRREGDHRFYRVTIKSFEYVSSIH